MSEVEVSDLRTKIAHNLEKDVGFLFDNNQ